MSRGRTVKLGLHDKRLALQLAEGSLDAGNPRCQLSPQGKAQLDIL